MATPLIINKSDFVGRVDLPANLSDIKKLNPHIQHAEDFDLRNLMGDRYFYHFISWFNTDGTLKTDAPDDVKNMFNGSVYEVDTVEWSNPGIKPVLVYFSAARLIKGIDLTVTPQSFATKTNEFSEQVSASRRNQQANEYENQAIAYWNQIRIYLGHNREDYPVYFVNHCGCGREERSQVRAKRFAIGGYNG